MVSWSKQKADSAKISTQGSDIVAIIKASKAAGLISLEATLETGPLKLTFATPAQHTDEQLELPKQPTNLTPFTPYNQPPPPSISEIRAKQLKEDSLSLDQLILTDPEAYEALSLGE